MKKILGLAAGVLLSVASIAQSGVTFTDLNEGYNKETAQTFNFNFSSNYTLDQINSTAAFYTSYFTVTAVAGDNGINVAIKLVEDTDMSRRVISRFFISMDIQQINILDKTVNLSDFMTSYIMKG